MAGESGGQGAHETESSSPAIAAPADQPVGSAAAGAAASAGAADAGGAADVDTNPSSPASAAATAMAADSAGVTQSTEQTTGPVGHAGASDMLQTGLPLLDELLSAFAGNARLGVIGYTTSKLNENDMTMAGVSPAVRESMQKWWEDGGRSNSEHDAAGNGNRRGVEGDTRAGSVRLEFTGYVDGTPLAVRREALEAIGGMEWKLKGVMDEVLAGWILCTRIWLAGYQVGKQRCAILTEWKGTGCFLCGAHCVHSKICVVPDSISSKLTPVLSGHLRVLSCS